MNVKELFFRALARQEALVMAARVHLYAEAKTPADKAHWSKLWHQSYDRHARLKNRMNSYAQAG